jgi:phosphoribosylformylglycinamidine synthase
MNYSVIVDVTLRKGIADPEGSTIERALPALGFTGVTNVEAENEEAALEKATSLGERLLSNPVIEDASARIGDR